MKTAIILGSRSDIAEKMIPLMKDWKIYPWYRTRTLPSQGWDLVICFVGQIRPVGLWHEVSDHDWEECVRSNVIAPVRLLRQIWKQRNPNASVCFFAGSNPNMIMPGYSAYNVGKMALLKAVEQLDAESDARIFALGPGIVLTKIHQATLDAKWDNPKLEAAMKKGQSTTVSKIWDCIKWCISQPKDVIGGRNICVSDAWNGSTYFGKHNLAEALKKRPEKFKLRRVE